MALIKSCSHIIDPLPILIKTALLSTIDSNYFKYFLLKLKLHSLEQFFKMSPFNSPIVSLVLGKTLTI